MDITKKVAKMKWVYHVSCMLAYALAGQKGLLNYDKAAVKAYKHNLQSLKCLSKLDYPVEQFLNEEKS